MGGGVPLTSDGHVIAGVGVSGGTTEQDISIVEAAMRSIAATGTSLAQSRSIGIAIVTRFVADDVQLPQLHRRVWLPPSIRRARPALPPAIEKALAEQHPVDDRPGRHRPRTPSNSELELQPRGSFSTERKVFHFQSTRRSRPWSTSSP